MSTKDLDAIRARQAEADARDLLAEVKRLGAELAALDNRWLEGCCEHRDPESVDLWRGTLCPTCAEAVVEVESAHRPDVKGATPIETQHITAQCRANRGYCTAWEQAAALLRQVYNAQIERDPDATISVAIYRVSRTDTEETTP